MFSLVCCSTILCCDLFSQISAQSAELKDQPAATSVEQKTKIRDTRILERITISAKAADSDLLDQKGSSQVLDPKELADAKQGIDDINRILRRVPGVNIQEEDGFGLRPNIGFRGVSVERSANITLMEDSVLIAPAPYAAPAAYFFPPIGRFNQVEVTKGAGQIKYGPRTTGGSLNLISTPIPNEFNLFSRLQAGSFESQLAHVNIGNSYKYGGWMLETYQNQSEGFKDLDGDPGADTGFDIQDYVGKFRINSDPSAQNYQELEFKFNVYDQESNETYLGLSENDFRANPNRRYRGSQLDNIDVDHSQLQLRHYIELANNFDLTTTLYRNDTERNWFKLESVNGISNSSILRSPAEFSTELDYIRGADSPEGVFALRNNDREYESMGIQTAVGKHISIGSTDHQFELGVRYHQDEEDRLQNEENYQMLNGTLVLNSIGAPGSNANRVNEADAWAIYLQDEISAGDFTLTPGVRYETIDLRRSEFGKEDPTRSGEDLIVTDNSINAVIPGLLVAYNLNQNTEVFTGIHKGFSPPTPSSDPDLEEEESVNLETGLKYADQRLATSLVGFYTNYQNLLGLDTLSGGGEGTGNSFNAGEATVLGIESTFAATVAKLSSKISVPFNLVYTYTNAEFDENFDSEFFGLVNSGDALPYIPENQLYFSLGLVDAQLWQIAFSGTYNDAMPTIAGQSGLSSTENTDSYVVFDLNAEYLIRDGINLYATFQNLFDEEYAVARRPAGFRPGLPQAFFAGLKINL